MPWLQNAFSHSSSSSPSSSKSHNDSFLNRFGFKSEVGSLFSTRPSWSLRHHRQRRLTRARKLRHLSDNDVGPPSPLDLSELSRSTSSFDNFSRRSPTGPQPLPLPDLQLLLKQDPNTSPSGPGKAPLPSSKKTSSAKVHIEERQRGADAPNVDANGEGAAGSGSIGTRDTFELCYSAGEQMKPERLLSSLRCIKSTSRDVRRNTEHAEDIKKGRSTISAATPTSRKPSGERNGVERNIKLSLPISSPTSTFSSPALSPPKSSVDFSQPIYMTPQVFQVWSAPEMPPLDSNSGAGLIYQIPYEKTAFSVDNSPLHSPLVSPRRISPTHSGPTSPLPYSFPGESTSPTNVHPLPLPPGAAMPSQPTSIPQVTAKSHLRSLKRQWKKGKMIGRGTFGSVYVASNRETGALCAMKEVELLPDDPKVAECVQQLEQEIKVLSQLKHPNIVQYYGSERVGDRLYIYLEYVHPGSITKYIHDHCEAITESVVRNFTRHILCGLAYLHSTKTIHRDIKGANLLVDAYGVVKLADFGMAKHLTGQAANLSLKGSPYWMAPELLQSVMQKDMNSNLALAVDIWSLGCTIIEMLNGKPPWGEYEGAAAMFKVLKETPPIPETLSPEGKDFLRCCFHRNPAERPSASMLLEHRFLKNNSQPLDISRCVQSLNRMKLTDKACNL